MCCQAPISEAGVKHPATIGSSICMMRLLFCGAPYASFLLPPSARRRSKYNIKTKN